MTERRDEAHAASSPAAAGPPHRGRPWALIQPQYDYPGAPTRGAVIFGALAIAIGLTVVAGWVLPLEPLRSFPPGAPPMRESAALVLALLGLGIVQRATGGPPVLVRAIGLVVLGGVSVLAAENLLQVDLGIGDRIGAGVAQPGAPYGGPIVVGAMIGFAAAAGALLIRRPATRALLLGEALAIVPGVIGTLGILGYLYGSVALTSIGSDTAIPFPAAVGFLILSSGLVSLDTRHRLPSVLGDPGGTGRIARRMLATALVGVPVAGVVGLAVTGGMVADAPDAMAVASVIVLVLLVVLGGLTISDTSQTDAVLARTAERLERQRTLGLAVAELDRRLLSLSQSVDVANEACRLVVQTGFVAMAWVGLIDASTQRVVPVARSGDRGYLQAVTHTIGDTPHGRGPSGEAIRTGFPVVINDIARAELMAPSWGEAEKHGYRSVAAFPIQHGDVVRGAFLVYATEVGAFQPGDVPIFMQLAADVALALNAIADEDARRVLQESLADSEERLRTAFDSMLEGTALHSAVRDEAGAIVDFRIDYSNPAAATISRVPMSELVGHTLLKLFPGHRANGLFAAYRTVVETGAPFAADDFHYVDPDAAGGALDQYLDLRAAKHGDGYVHSVRDVTERRLVAMRLQGSEYLVRETQRAAAIGSYRATFAEDRWEGSEVLDTILGIDATYPRTVAGWLDLIHPADRAEMERYLQGEVLLRRQQFNREYRIVRASDAATRWVHGLGAVTLDADGNVATLVGTIQDITARRMIETEMRRLSTAIEQSTDSVVVTDAAGLIEYVNPAFERASGYTRAEVLGQNPRIIQSGVQDPAFYATMWATLTNGQPFTADFTNRHKDGSLFQETSVISPIFDEAGKITSYLAVKRDVTRERAYEASATRTAHERALITDTIRALRPADTVEATAQAICCQILNLSGLVAAALYVFELDHAASALGFAAAGQADPELRRLPIQRSRHLAAHAAEGAWIEPWVNRPWHPYNKVLTGLGVSSVAYTPIHHAGGLIGFLAIGTTKAVDDPSFTEVLPALVEFAALSGAILGRDIQARTRLHHSREMVAVIIRTQAFRPVFQPIVDAVSGGHVGYEALTRFTDETRPDIVFADARTAGLEAELELATLAAAIREAAVLPKEAWLSLNVSPGLVTSGPPLGRLLRKAGRPIVLEITEHVAVEDYPAVRAAVTKLRPAVRVAIDDAGSGVANFHHIVELRPSFVKLDISLIADIDTDLTRQALVVGLLQFAAESGSQAIAEGVETEAQLATLRRLGVNLVQGNLLGRPAPATE
jgi:PAS domain S-box-containing protein